MTIASEITRIQNNIAAAYTAASGKGATLPATENSDNLATCIGSIPSGGSGVGIPREIVNGVWQVPSLTTYSLPSGVTEIGNSGFSSSFWGCTSLTSVDFITVTTVGDNGFGSAFRGCTSLQSISFPALTTIGTQGFNSAFGSCQNLTSISFPSLTTSSFVGTNKNYFSNMMLQTGTSTTHTIHFPSNLESTVQGLNGYPLFGGTSGSVVCAFDLPATN